MRWKKNGAAASLGDFVGVGFLVILAMLVGVGAVAAATHWGFVPLLEAVTGKDIPFWPTFISAIALTTTVGFSGSRK